MRFAAQLSTRVSNPPHAWRTGPAKRIPNRQRVWVLEAADTKYIRQRLYPATVVKYLGETRDYVLTAGAPGLHRFYIRPAARVFDSLDEAYQEKAVLENRFEAGSKAVSTEIANQGSRSFEIIKRGMKEIA